MNMNKALQNLYHAVSGSTTTKVNISKLLIDIHYAITGVESSVKNNWSRIIDSMATNWPEGGGSSITVEPLSVTANDTYTAPTGKAYSPVTVNVSGGSSDFSTAEVTLINSTTGSGTYTVHIAQVYDGQNGGIAIGNLNVSKDEPITITVPLYKNNYAIKLNEIESASTSVMPTTTGDITFSPQGFLVQGNGTITMSSN